MFFEYPGIFIFESIIEWYFYDIKVTTFNIVCKVILLLKM